MFFLNSVELTCNKLIVVYFQANVLWFSVMSWKKQNRNLGSCSSVCLPLPWSVNLGKQLHVSESPSFLGQSSLHVLYFIDISAVVYQIEQLIVKPLKTTPYFLFASTVFFEFLLLPSKPTFFLANYSLFVYSLLETPSHPFFCPP